MRKKHIFNIIKEKDGTTMVEVLVAFVVVVLMMATFSKIITASVNLLSKSRQIIQKTETFDTNYYKTAERSKREVVSSKLSLSISDKTSNKNTADDVTLELPKGALNLYQDSETGYQRYSVGIVDAETETPTDPSTPTDPPKEPEDPPKEPDKPGASTGTGDPVVPPTDNSGDLEQKVANYFAGDENHKWITYPTIEKNTEKAVNVYVRVDEIDGKKYVTVYSVGYDIDNTNIKKIAAEVAGTDNYELLNLDKDKITNNGVDNLLIIFGDTNKYNNLQLYFNETNGELMAIRYKDLSKNTFVVSFYGSYTSADVKGL